MEGVLDGDVIPLGKWAEAFYTLDGAHGGEIERGRAAAGFDAGVGGGSVAVDVEDDGDGFAVGGAGIGFAGEPVLRDLGVDDLDVVGEACAEGAVFDGDAGGAVFELGGGLRDADAAVSPVVAFMGCGGTGWTCFGGAGAGFSATLGGFFALSGMASSSGLGGGSVFSFVMTGAGLGVSEVRTPVSRVGCLGGSGRAATMVAWMAPASEAFSPQGLLLAWKTKAQPTMSAATRPWRTSEPAKLPRRLSPLAVRVKLE